MLVGNTNINNLLFGSQSGADEAHAYLLYGPKNVGKTTFALEFAKKLLCEKENFPCGKCPNCIQAEKLSHPDLYVFDDEENISVEKIRDLISFLDLKPYQARKKIAIISNIERMSVSAANAFLKTLEEPTPETVIILTVTNQKNILPTIVSRCRNIRFSFAKDEEIHKLLNDTQASSSEKERINILAKGRPGLAKTLAENPEKLSEIFDQIEDFSKYYFSDNLFLKVRYAESLAKGKIDLANLYNYLEIYFHQKLLGESGNLKIVRLLDKLSETREYLAKNVNAQLALESLLFEGDK